MSEEFYDHHKDPNEWKNLVENPEHKTMVDEHRAGLPQTSHPILGKGSTGHEAFNASEAAKPGH